MPMRPIVALLASLSLIGCVGSSVQQGLVIGAATGAATGATVGVLISNEDLLGSSASPDTGDTSIQPGSGIAVGLLTGAVFGAIIGGMVGHINDDGDDVAVAIEEPEEEDEPDYGLDEDEMESAGEEARRVGPLRF